MIDPACRRPAAPAAPTDDAAFPQHGPDRSDLEARWLRLTRVTLPRLAQDRRWPIIADHCFQRVLLDAATGGVWYDAVAGRPAYKHITGEALSQAVALGEAVRAGTADLTALNRQSLAWRRARR